MLGMSAMMIMNDDHEQSGAQRRPYCVTSSIPYVVPVKYILIPLFQA